MPAIKESMRYRVNVGVTSKGLVSWDTTVEGTAVSQEYVLAQSDALVALMQQRYPIGELQAKDA